MSRRRNLKDKCEQEFDSFRQQMAHILDVILFFPNRYRANLWQPPTDIYECESSIIVKIEVAGMNQADFNISFVDHVLSIQGIRKDTEEKLKYHCLEIPYGKFHVRIRIPGSCIEENIKAKYENGYLYIVILKSKKCHDPVEAIDVKVNSR